MAEHVSMAGWLPASLTSSFRFGQKLLVKSCINHKEISDYVSLMSRMEKETGNAIATSRSVEARSNEAKTDPEALFIDLDM
ncbi:MAG: hypothetical protein OK474_09700 [Thaumarchaeota archaeon]|nr:hypothetical protein [Nitrososphaerota archaeon]